MTTSTPRARVVPSLSGTRRIHIVAAGGAAMSAIAHILADLGHAVSGSDLSESAAVDALRARGVPVAVGHDASLVDGADLVVVSTAVPETNPELAEAHARGIPVAGRPEMMEAFGRLRRVVAVSGTHGKTTTSAMTALALRSAEPDLSFIVGGVVRQLGTGVHWGPGEWLVAEADESDGSFLRFGAEAVVITNIEEDHLDYWRTLDALESGFDRFALQARTVCVVAIDDDGSARLAQRMRSAGRRVVTTGVHPTADYRIVGYEAQGLRSSFDVERRGEQVASLALSVPGMHNARNAIAALAVSAELGADPVAAAAAVSSFTGVGRRFEYRGEANGVTFVDDYAHLPTEVAATVQAAVGGGWTRVVAVFQPHRYTRIQALGTAFADSFVGADVVLVTDLYAAGQAPIEGVDASMVSDAVIAAHPRQDVRVVSGRAALVELLEHELRAGDLCLTMNAGDLTTLPDELLARPWATR